MKSINDIILGSSYLKVSKERFIRPVESFDQLMNDDCRHPDYSSYEDIKLVEFKEFGIKHCFILTNHWALERCKKNLTAFSKIVRGRAHFYLGKSDKDTPLTKDSIYIDARSFEIVPENLELISNVVVYQKLIYSMNHSNYFGDGLFAHCGIVCGEIGEDESIGDYLHTKDYNLDPFDPSITIDETMYPNIYNCLTSRYNYIAVYNNGSIRELVRRPNNFEGLAGVFVKVVEGVYQYISADMYKLFRGIYSVEVNHYKTDDPRTIPSIIESGITRYFRPDSIVTFGIYGAIDMHLNFITAVDNDYPNLLYVDVLKDAKIYSYRSRNDYRINILLPWVKLGLDPKYHWDDEYAKNFWLLELVSKICELKPLDKEFLEGEEVSYDEYGEYAF